MKRIMKSILLVMALAFVSVAGLSVSAKAAAITGLKQTGASTSSFEVTCATDLNTSYYALEVSTDQVNWTVKDKSTDGSFYVGDLAAGSTYYVRATGFADYYLKQPVATVSEVIDVVTVPNATGAKLTQTGATTSSMTYTISGVSGANMYALGSNYSFAKSTIMAKGNSSTLTASKLLPGTSYNVYAYAGRRSSVGYEAWPSYDLAADYSGNTLPGKISKANFGVTTGFTNIDTYYWGVYTGACDGVVYRFQNKKGKTIRTVVGESGQSSNGTISNRITNIGGTFYKVSVAPYVTCGTKRVYGEWSPVKCFAVTSNVKWVRKVSQKKMKLSWKKVSGAVKYQISISTSQNSGYKKVTTTKKRTAIVKKCGKKRLKKGKKYYIRIIPMIKSGKKYKKADLYYTGYTTFY
ncbi:MAG: hypothetical protein K6G62_00190 [Eubacterium sp.]|nr:hypothetical protein [Eubacterium sp.]